MGSRKKSPSVRSYHRFLFACFCQNRYEEAVACYTECIGIDPDNVAVYTNRALCYLRLNQVIVY